MPLVNGRFQPDAMVTCAGISRGAYAALALQFANGDRSAEDPT